MKQLIFILTFSFISSTISAQYVNQFIKSDMGALQNALDDRQSEHDKNEKYISNLIDWIYDLKSKTNDLPFLKALDVNIQKLISFENEDLSLIGKNIRQVELNIKEEIVKYNQRVQLENEKAIAKKNEENDPNKYWNEGNRFLSNKEYYSAIQNYNQVIRLSDDFAGVYFNRGIAYQYISNFGSAIEDFSKFIQLEPNNPNGYEARGWAKFAKEDYFGALADFKTLIEINPESANGYLNRGTAKSKLNDEYGAIDDFKKAIEKEKKFSMAYNGLAWSKFKMKKFNEGLMDVNKAIDLDSTNYVAYDTRAEIKFNLNNFSGCIKDSDIALRLNPKLENAFFLKGRSYYKLGNRQKACEFWSKSGELGKKEAYEYISKFCQN